MQLLPDDLSIEPYAIALPRGDWALRLAVNTALRSIYARQRDRFHLQHLVRPDRAASPAPLLSATFMLNGLAD